MTATLTAPSTPVELIAALEESGTGEDALVHMLRKCETRPDLTIDEFVSELKSELQVSIGRNEVATVGEGTMKKIPFLLAGKPIPIERSRISASMLAGNRPPIIQPLQPAAEPSQMAPVVGPVSKSDVQKTPPQAIGPVSSKK